ncbi:YgfZ/GcvT domain-containing protein [Thiomicrorhabdus aquaedulcis]|uniref:CAF17-like 4Fe-4S cluster assembly/insertion protein YgfZ n=1 Tax=Thiomicrorhabdus aquaedulcis TaxID=2211106 RepID=UPI000FD923BB|nr:folate-binding protein YgfZ [Thiomicrorhabdus aquaedulcis]
MPTIATADDSAATNSTWLDFLNSQHAQWNVDGTINSFGQPELEHYLVKHGPVLANLSHQALLKISGNDATSFLQGQLTNDLHQVTEQLAQLSAYCDPKGQVLAIFLIFKHQDAFYLTFENSLKESILKRLKMFVMRADVQITDMANTLIQIGYAGEFADVDIQRRLNTKVKNTYETGHIDLDGMRDVLVVKVPGPYHKYAILGPVEQIINVWTLLKATCDVTNNSDWNLLDIAAGIPEVNSSTSGQFIAQFLNLDKLDAINFKKGCFPGQEIIARVHYRGKVTKRMLRVHLEEEMPLSPGDVLTLNDSNGRNHNFDVIKAQRDIFSGTLCLAIGTLKSLDAVEGNLISQSGKAAIIEPLPYSITDDE